MLYQVDDDNHAGMQEIRDKQRQKVSHRPAALHQDQQERPRYLGMPRDFSETKLLDRMIVPPGRKIKLARDFATSWKEGRAFDKRRAAERLREGVQLLSEFQSKLYAQNRYALLVALQAMDAAGKDRTIQHVMSGLNPQGCRVTSFQTPSAEQLHHHYLWRPPKGLPEPRHIPIFNRS